MRKEITTSDYDFKELIEGNQFYADKSDFLHKLVTTHRGCFFLSRPRRFGKSLMLSTLKYIFEGKRNLFAGLKIDQLAYDWKVYPVIHLNIAKMSYSSKEEFVYELSATLYAIAQSMKLTLPIKGSPGFLFGALLDEAAAQSPMGKVVLLIDEYDAPLVNTIGKPHYESLRDTLYNFYGHIKSSNSNLRFTMITGVTRFTKVSIFSALNHMEDISMNLEYATMFGYTQVELEEYFGDRMEELAQKRGIDVEALKQKIKVWYNGYRFHPLAPTLYNPVSIGQFLNQNEFENWWFDTASPTFLIKELRKKPTNYFDMLHKPVGREVLNTFDASRIDSRSLLFQSGYLTIVDAINEEDDTGWWFTLGFPNKEVELSLNTYLAAELGTGDTSDSLYAARTLARLIRRGDTEGIFETIHAHFAAIPYDALALNEGNFKALLFFLFRMTGVIVSAEHYTNKGRVDLVIEAPEHNYVFEYKYDSSAAEAMEQIYKKGYYEQFKQCGKRIHLVAINYDPKLRNIGSDRFEEILM